jgi:hypothetical protein
LARLNWDEQRGIQSTARPFLDAALQKHWPRMLISRQVFHHNSAMPVAAVAPIVYADYLKDGSADREDRPEEMARFPLPGGVWPACLQHEE